MVSLPHEHIQCGVYFYLWTSRIGVYPNILTQLTPADLKLVATRPLLCFAVLALLHKPSYIAYVAQQWMSGIKINSQWSQLWHLFPYVILVRFNSDRHKMCFDMHLKGNFRVWLFSRAVKDLGIQVWCSAHGISTNPESFFHKIGCLFLSCHGT